MQRAVSEHTASALFQALLQLLEALPEPLVRRESLTMLAEESTLLQLEASLSDEQCEVVRMIRGVLEHLMTSGSVGAPTGESFDAQSLVAVLAAAMTQMDVEFGVELLSPTSQRSYNGILGKMLLQVLHDACEEGS